MGIGDDVSDALTSAVNGLLTLLTFPVVDPFVVSTNSTGPNPEDRLQAATNNVYVVAWQNL